MSSVTEEDHERFAELLPDFNFPKQSDRNNWVETAQALVGEEKNIKQV